MFHSVGLENHPWVWSYISEPLETFEAKVALLVDKGFTGVFWQDLYEHMAGRRRLPDNSILLTFDDGYLDNWVYVYPILKKYGVKGTIFVNPDFVHPAGEVRPNLDDVVADRCSRDELTVPGFLSWAEMREMEKSGLIDIQSHSISHTWYFSGPKIIDFHRPHPITPHPWLFWNARPDRKPIYLTEDQQGFVPWGHPILEHQKSLVVRRFFPEERSITNIVAYVSDQGGRAFFQGSNWKGKLAADLDLAAGVSQLPGRYETVEEQRARIVSELRSSKERIERNLKKTVDFICWPGGGNDKFVQQAALSVGYKSWTLSSRDQTLKRNVFGSDPVSIKRMGTSNTIAARGRPCGIGGPYFQLFRVLKHQGSALGAAALRTYKLGALFRSFWRAR